MSTDTKEKRKRAPRRNYERELRELAMYIEVKLEVLGSLNGNGANHVQAIETLTDILARLNGAK